MKFRLVSKNCLVATPQTCARSPSWGAGQSFEIIQRWTAKKQFACCCGLGAMNIYLKACIFGGNCILLYSDAPRGNLKNNRWDPIHHRTDRWGQDPRTCDALWIRRTSATGNTTSKTKWMESLFGGEVRCVFWLRCVHPILWLCTPNRSIDNSFKIYMILRTVFCKICMYNQ